MGTPAFAADILQSLLDAPDVRVAACWTQPDKVAGRGKKLTPSPVKQLALQRGIPVFQPASLRSPEAQAEAAVAKIRNEDAKVEGDGDDAFFKRE